MKAPFGAAYLGIVDLAIIVLFATGFAFRLSLLFSTGGALFNNTWFFAIAAANLAVLVFALRLGGQLRSRGCHWHVFVVFVIMLGFPMAVYRVLINTTSVSLTLIAVTVPTLTVYLTIVHGMQTILKRWHLRWIGPDSMEIESRKSEIENMEWHGQYLTPLEDRPDFELGHAFRRSFSLAWCGYIACELFKGFTEGPAYVITISLLIAAFSIMVRVQKQISRYRPPIGFFGRFITNRFPILPYDKIYLVPILGGAILVATGYFAFIARDNPALTLSFGLFVFFLSQHTLPPRTHRWALTGKHRIVPGPMKS